METRIIEITNKSGFHVRPAARLSKFAENCSSKVEIIYGDSIVNVKSMLNLVSTGITQGTKVELRCTGKNEQKDIEYMTDAMKRIED